MYYLDGSCKRSKHQSLLIKLSSDNFALPNICLSIMAVMVETYFHFNLWLLLSFRSQNSVLTHVCVSINIFQLFKIFCYVLSWRNQFKISYDLWFMARLLVWIFYSCFRSKTLFMCMNLSHFIFLAKGKFLVLHHFDLYLWFKSTFESKGIKLLKDFQKDLDIKVLLKLLFPLFFISADLCRPCMILHEILYISLL